METEEIKNQRYTYTAKRKKFLLLLLMTLVLAATTYAVYVFAIPKDMDTRVVYNTDKYQETTSWCNVSSIEESIIVDCKALLFDIRNEDSSSCFDVQVISNSNELKDLTICESEDTLSYTNEVLKYKKLMPLDIIFTYTRKDLFGDYVFKEVSFSSVDDAYIENIVNEDIAQLVSVNLTENLKLIRENEDGTLVADLSQYIVSNSVDYCPKPNILGDSISDINRTNYENFYQKYLVSKDEYSSKFSNNDTTSAITQLFGCNSSTQLGYNLCDTDKLANQLVSDVAEDLFISEVDWSNNVEDLDKYLIRKTSMFYDNLYLKDSKYTIQKGDINKITSQINALGKINESTFCSLYFLFNSISSQNVSFEKNVKYIKNEVEKNLKNISSMICQDVIYQDNLDKSGAYLQMYIQSMGDKSTLRIYDRCDNLNHFFN